jgi:hypothetical protein
MDAVELAFVEGLPRNQVVVKGVSPDLATITHNGRTVDIPEWSQMWGAESTLVKLVLVVRFYRKIAPIWKDLDAAQKTKALRNNFCSAGAIIGCLTECCGNNLIRFHAEQPENPFRHRNYACHCRVDRHITAARTNVDLNLKSIEENYLELCHLLVSRTFV